MNGIWVQGWIHLDYPLYISFNGGQPQSWPWASPPPEEQQRAVGSVQEEYQFQHGVRPEIGQQPAETCQQTGGSGAWSTTREQVREPQQAPERSAASEECCNGSPVKPPACLEGWHQHCGPQSTGGCEQEGSRTAGPVPLLQPLQPVRGMELGFATCSDVQQEELQGADPTGALESSEAEGWQYPHRRGRNRRRARCPAGARGRSTRPQSVGTLGAASGDTSTNSFSVFNADEEEEEQAAKQAGDCSPEVEQSARASAKQDEVAERVLAALFDRPRSRKSRRPRSGAEAFCQPQSLASEQCGESQTAAPPAEPAEPAEPGARAGCAGACGTGGVNPELPEATHGNPGLERPGIQSRLQREEGAETLAASTKGLGRSTRRHTEQLAAPAGAGAGDVSPARGPKRSDSLETEVEGEASRFYIGTPPRYSENNHLAAIDANATLPPFPVPEQPFRGETAEIEQPVESMAATSPEAPAAVTEPSLEIESSKAIEELRARFGADSDIVRAALEDLAAMQQATRSGTRSEK